jgi:hypothetical protein
MAHAVNTNPEWLVEAWFVDDLVSLSVGYLQNVFSAR